MDFKTAREIIGVSEDFTIEELNKKYYALTEEILPRDELTEIHNAYNLLLEHLEAQQPDVPFREKLNNFFYHHKWQLFFGLIFTVIIGLLIHSIVDAQIEKMREAKLPPPAVEIMLFGEYVEGTDLTPLEDNVYDLFPEWDRVKIHLTYAPGDAETQFDMASMQKSAAILSIERPDIYIFDSIQFDRLKDEAPFVPLDILRTMPETEEHWLEFKPMNADEQDIYAVDLTGHEIFKDTDIARHEEYIFTIRDDAEQEDNAIELLLELLKDFE